MKTITYYPGCSLDSSAWEYRESMEETFELLDYDLSELEDWNCCGATSAHGADAELALALPARNLALASASTDRLIVPCAACYSRQKAAEVEFAAHPETKSRMELKLGRSFDREVTVVNIVDFLSGELGRIRERLVRPLAGLKIACYYGCLLTRPPKTTGDPSYEDPQGMEMIVSSIGANPVDWSYKTECCGASHTIARADLVQQLVSKILAMALEAGAEAIVTACPMCQANLDGRQRGAEAFSKQKFNLPVLYITEAVSAALGSQRSSRFLKGHFVRSEMVMQAFGAT